MFDSIGKTSIYYYYSFGGNFVCVFAVFDNMLCVIFIDTFIIYPSNAIQLYKSRNILEYITNHKAIKLKQFLDNDDNEK